MAFSLAVSGCVRDAVLENDVRNAQWQARVLNTATDLEIAEAALSGELVELEALYQRAPQDERVLTLLVRGYGRMAHGFIEARRLEALVSGDQLQATHQAERRAAALSRSAFYASVKGHPKATHQELGNTPGPMLIQAETACKARDRAQYEQKLSQVLATRDELPESRLDNALARRLARSWLSPVVRSRCGF